MKTRRSVLYGVVTVSVGVSTGCLDTFSGGRFVGGADPTQLSAQRGEIVDIYAGAIEKRNDGVRTRDDAIHAFNDESYDEAIDGLETAIEHFEGAKGAFADAAALALELGEDEVGSICETAEKDADLQIVATGAALKAAEAAADGDGPAEINGHVEEYRDLLEQAEEVPVEDPQTLVEVIESG